MSITPYSDINAFIDHYRTLVIRDYGSNLVGMYLTGSLTYEAFVYASSDIDVTSVVRESVSPDEFSVLRGIHDEVEREFPLWAERFECTYTPIAGLKSVSPPQEPRPWYWGGEGRLYPEAPYGNEWIINSYFLVNYAKSLYGPEYREIAPPVDKEEVQKACVRDLLAEWVPKGQDPSWFKDSHHRAYFVLNLCRIVATVCSGNPCSKPAAAAWAIDNLETRFHKVVDNAIKWRHGVHFEFQRESMDLLDEVLSVISKTEVYVSMRDVTALPADLIAMDEHSSGLRKSTKS